MLEKPFIKKKFSSLRSVLQKSVAKETDLVLMVCFKRDGDLQVYLDSDNVVCSSTSVWWAQNIGNAVKIIKNQLTEAKQCTESKEH